MNGMRITLLATAAFLPLGCADAALEPMAPEPARADATAAGLTAVSGSYDAVVDFSTLLLTTAGGNCRLVVDGALIFSGSIQGAATGTTTALIFAPCDEVAAAPGTHRDVFTSELHSVGTVNGEPAEADGLYQGITEVGGAIDGRIIFSNGIAGVLDVDATVAVGGTYKGEVVLP